MANIIDQFFISIGLKTEDVQKGMADLEGKLSAGFEHIANTVVAPLLGALSVSSLFQNIIAEADSIGKFADQIGVAAGELQAWGESAKLAGGSMEGLQGSIKGLNDKLSDLSVKGQGESLDFFRALGVDALDANGKARSAFDVMKDIAGSIEDMSRQESAGILQKLGMDSGTIQLLQQGKLALEDALKLQKEIGVYTKEDTQIAANFNDAVDKLTRSFKMAFVPIMRTITPLLTKFGEAAMQAFIYLRKHAVVSQTVVAGLAAMFMVKLLPAIKATTMAMLRNPLTWLIAAFVALGLVVEDFFYYLDGGKSALNDFWSYFGTADEIKASFALMWEYMQGIVQAISEIKLTDYISPGVVEGITYAWRSLFLMVLAIGVSLYDLSKTIIKAFNKKGPSPFLDALKAIGGMLLDVSGFVAALAISIISYFLSILGLAIEVVNGIVEYFINGSGTIKDIFDGICRFISGFCGIASKLIGILCKGIVALFERMAKGVFGVFGRIADKIGSLKNGFMDMIGLGKEADQLSLRGGSRVSNTMITDNSTTNNYVSRTETGNQSKIYPYLGAVSGVD